MQDGQDQNQPGWVFKPGDSPSTTPQSPGSEAPSEPVPATAEPQPAAQTDISTDDPHIEWTASEYQANPKSAGWFTLLALAAVALAIVVYFVTKDIVSTVVTVVVGIIIGVFAARQPRVLQYRIDNRGLYVGEKFYPYESFKSFSIARDQALGYISLMPLKRFMPPLSVHYAPEDEDKIADTLSVYLPYEEHKPDIVDNLTRRFRF